jgi:hypothetical protein
MHHPASEDFKISVLYLTENLTLAVILGNSKCVDHMLAQSNVSADAVAESTYLAADLEYENILRLLIDFAKEKSINIDEENLREQVLQGEVNDKEKRTRMILFCEDYIDTLKKDLVKSTSRANLLFAAKFGKKVFERLWKKAQCSPKNITSPTFGGCANVASKANDVELLQILLAEGVDVNETMDHDDCYTPLHSAASEGAYDAANFLLENDADIEAIDLKEESSLMTAIRNSRLAIVQLLLDNGAKTDIANSEGISPLMLSFSLLCEQSDDPDRKEIFDLLWKSSSKDSIDEVKALRAFQTFNINKKPKISH